MEASDVVSWLIDECVTVLSTTNTVSLSTPADHADIAQSGSPPTYPFVGIQTIGADQESAGLGSGSLFVDDLSYDTNDVLQSITFARVPIRRYEIVPVTDDDPKRRDQLVTDVADHFSRYERDTGSLPTDMNTLTTDSPSNQDRTSDYVRADGLPLDIEYTRYIVEDDPTVAETVTVDLDAGDEVHVNAIEQLFS